MTNSSNKLHEIDKPNNSIEKMNKISEYKYKTLLNDYKIVRSYYRNSTREKFILYLILMIMNGFVAFAFFGSYDELLGVTPIIAALTSIISISMVLLSFEDWWNVRRLDDYELDNKE